MTRHHVIAQLKQNNGYVSGEQISRHLKISRSAVWKIVRDLRQDGYDIEAVTRRGYRLLKSPDRLDAHEILSGLDTKCLGRDIICLEETVSTMHEAMELAMTGAPEGTMVIADSQTAGKGRLGRAWASPGGQGLYLSLILCPKLSVRDVPLLTLMSAVAVCQTIREAAGIEAKIKWPNDILIQGRKLSGILMEMNADMDGIKFVVLGIGLNVNTPLKSLPANSASLKSETHKVYSRVQVLWNLLRNLEMWYGKLVEQGPEIVLNQWRQWSDTLGRQIKMDDQQGMIRGRAVDIDAFGRLMVEDNRGQVFFRMTGDVVNVK